MYKLVFAGLAVASLWAEGSGRIDSVYSSTPIVLSADPTTAHWRTIAPTISDKDHFGKPIAGHRTEIRSRWTDKNLYFLFTCPYEQLNLKEDPKTQEETNKLWQWDVAEVFIGSDFEHIWQYKELQVSPQGEWVDLDIDRKTPLPEGGWKWNSGFKVKARLDREKKIWYGEMEIPLAALYPHAGADPAHEGSEMRLNVFRIQGAKENKKYVVWQQTGVLNNHVPEAFGRIRLVKSKQ